MQPKLPSKEEMEQMFRFAKVRVPGSRVPGYGLSLPKGRDLSIDPGRSRALFFCDVVGPGLDK
jgi:hypothetical protein